MNFGNTFLSSWCGAFTLIGQYVQWSIGPILPLNSPTAMMGFALTLISSIYLAYRLTVDLKKITPR